MRKTFLILLILCIMLSLLIRPVPVEPIPEWTYYGTLTAAEQGVFRDILTAVEAGSDTVSCTELVSHTRILTQLGIHYGTLSDLSPLYQWENGSLRLNLERFRQLEAQRLSLEARISELMLHISPGSDRQVLRQIARTIAQHRDYAEGVFVCGDYAILFHKMAQRMGISGELCFGRVDGTLHAWNMVILQGRARYYDITWYDGDLPDPRYLCRRSPWGRTATLGDKWIP